MIGDDLTSYMGKAMEMIEKINKMSIKIQQGKGGEMHLSQECGRMLVLREAYLSKGLREGVEAHMRRDPQATVWELVEGA